MESQEECFAWGGILSVDRVQHGVVPGVLCLAGELFFQRTMIHVRESAYLKLPAQRVEVLLVLRRLGREMHHLLWNSANVQARPPQSPRSPCGTRMDKVGTRGSGPQFCGAFGGGQAAGAAANDKKIVIVRRGVGHHDVLVARTIAAARSASVLAGGGHG